MKLKIFLAVFSVMIIVAVYYIHGLTNDAGKNQTCCVTSSEPDVRQIEGEITYVNHPVAVFKDNSGGEYTVYMGPYWYWVDNNYKLEVNRKIKIKGLYKTIGNKNELFPYEITQDGSVMTFTDEKGVPKWSGSNKNGNTGSGKNNGCGNCEYNNNGCGTKGK